MLLKHTYTSVISGFNDDVPCRVFEISALDLNGDGDYEFKIKDDDRTYFQDKPWLRKFARQYDLLRKNKRDALIAMLPVEAFLIQESAQDKLFR